MVASHVARAGKTRPVMTEKQIYETVLLYGNRWRLHNLGQRFSLEEYRKG